MAVVLSARPVDAAAIDEIAHLAQESVLHDDLRAPPNPTFPPGTSLDVEVHGTDLDAVAREIEAVGGVEYGRVDGFFVEARVPADKVGSLGESPHVTQVGDVTLATPGENRSLTTNVALQTTVSDAIGMERWHEAGHTGAGQRIGILDIFGTGELEFAISEERVPTPAGAFCRHRGQQCLLTIQRQGVSHGVAVAEIIHQMAPNAELYLATVTTLSDLSEAIDWFIENDVTVINRSETSELDGPGDGTGPTASIVDRAVENDIVWVSAAGNAAGTAARGGHNWVGTFNDPDGNGFHNFANGSERLGFTCGFLAGMRWDDWDDTTIATDYDIFIFDELTQNRPEALGFDEQTSPADLPLEHIETVCSGPSDRDYIAIRQFADEEPDGNDTIQILGNVIALDEWVNARSATGPGNDSANPGALTVGATVSPIDLTIADFSSQGPTFDGRIGIDLLGPSCLPIPDFFNFCFSGTSASAPVVAGAVAVLRGAEVIEEAAEADTVARLIVQDLGAPGPDPLYGYGSLSIPSPETLGARASILTCQGLPATIVGSPGDDVLRGTDDRDIIFGGGGDDVIYGLDGADLICGGFGDDEIIAGNGNDEVHAGPGLDTVRGNDGADLIFGGHGHDDLEGNGGNDEVRGFTGRDYVKGGLGDDFVYGGAGNDRIVGGAGLDELFGGNGVDRCREPIEVAVSCRG